ncbi:NIPSNAP family containing protein [Actinospongicola halichondriae]|uniref:NIPSNAP family containing protein n=1 Tax=Actinospongicola halichondriae TaxID=3236844 RepID=UPI003D5CA16D
MTEPINDRVYIHEVIDIRGHHRADYMHHMAANWSPLAQETRDQKLFGMWSVLGSTGPWPKVVNIWEERGFAGLAASFAGEAVGPGAQDPALEKWWAKANEFRSGGFDRLVKPAPWSPSIDDLCASGAGGVAYAHETISVRAGSSWDFLDLVRERAVPVYGAFGCSLVGAFVTTMVDDDECILLWSFPTWDDWARFEDGHLPGGDPGLRDWRAWSSDLVTARHRILLVDAPLSPLRTGRQPTRDDQTDWTE